MIASSDVAGAPAAGGERCHADETDSQVWTDAGRLEPLMGRGPARHQSRLSSGTGLDIHA
jgi:hypothetical protein